MCAVLCLVAQLCLPLFYPVDCSPPGSSVHGIFQARILKVVSISYSRDWPVSLASPALAGRTFVTSAFWEARNIVCCCCCLVAQSCLTICDPWTVSTRLPCPWDFPDKNTGVGCHFLLQEGFPTQGSNPCLLCLLHWQAGSSPLAPPGEPIDVWTSMIINKGILIVECSLFSTWIMPIMTGSWHIWIYYNSFNQFSSAR